jgi:mannose/fructose-specific phosphotransferase system component IIA
MSKDGVRGVVLAHGQMAQGLVDAVAQIAGVSGDFLTGVSNKGVGPEALADQVCGLAGSEPMVVFTDLVSGSCGFAARRCVKDNGHIAVISGVNLPMLLEFVMKRHLPIEELVPLLMTKARASICCSPATFETNEHRAVSRG